jgi:hypothetical protein
VGRVGIRIDSSAQLRAECPLRVSWAGTTVAALLAHHTACGLSRGTHFDSEDDVRSDLNGFQRANGTAISVLCLQGLNADDDDRNDDERHQATPYPRGSQRGVRLIKKELKSAAKVLPSFCT